MKYILLLLCLFSLPVMAQQKETQEIAYYGFEPDIVTNYISGNYRNLGYVRVSVELMLPDKRFLKTIEHHEPLILDTVIGILSKQPEDKVKSLNGREEIRINILNTLQQIIYRETGENMIQDVLFTKYLYQ